jgi:tetratricopeptide (TPR) repeat protein
VAFLSLTFVMIQTACQVPGASPTSGAEPLRVGQVASKGDPARRASQRLVMQGLEADAAHRSGEAIASYERALQVDPTNPIAYLALARYSIAADEPRRALNELDQAESLLGSDAESLGARAHLEGLRGQALRELGRDAEADAHLARARSLAPAVWSDGQLDARELR